MPRKSSIHPVQRGPAVADDITWALRVAARYSVATNITYTVANGLELKLDVYQPCDERTAYQPPANTPKTTLLFIHAGAWMDGNTKETWALWFLPFLQLGWVVVNIDYRSAGIAPAPAAVEDCLCALRWIGRNAAAYNIDTRQLIIGGLSAGGHLALTTGMLPRAISVLDEQSEGEISILTRELVAEAMEFVRPAAIINWCGITDVADLLKQGNRQDFAVQWVGEQPHKMAIARRVSPLTYVRPGLPPIISIHGDGDLIVPYSHATRLHAALSRAGVVNKLITLRGEGHAFGVNANLYAYPQIFEFIARAGVSVQQG